ncbi:MAG: cupin domain-containing protein [candidate division Zixibacteria bacterium]
MSFVKLTDLEEKEPVGGCRVRFIHTDNMTLAYWEISAGATVPDHNHPHEQVVNVIEGEFALVVDGEKHILKSGLAFTLDSDVIHGGTAISDCRIIDVFHPVREDYR